MLILATGSVVWAQQVSPIASSKQSYDTIRDNFGKAAKEMDEETAHSRRPPNRGKLLITTTGIITSGTDPAGLFGAGMNLAGQSYTLTILCDAPGSSYFAGATGTFASDISDPIQGFVSATVSGDAITAPLENSTSATLVEDLYHFYGANSGLDATGNFASVSQDVECVNTCVPYADLLTQFFYTLKSGDVGVDTYTFTNAAGTATVSFVGVPASIAFRWPRSRGPGHCRQPGCSASAALPMIVATAPGANPCDSLNYGAVGDGVIGANAGTTYLLGSVLGAHPYPTMVRDFHRVIGREARAQILKAQGKLPEAVIACVGGGSNAIGIFYEFIKDKKVRLIGVEAGGRGEALGEHAARFRGGSPGVLQGTYSYVLQDSAGQIATHALGFGGAGLSVDWAGACGIDRCGARGVRPCFGCSSP